MVKISLNHSRLQCINLKNWKMHCYRYPFIHIKETQIEFKFSTFLNQINIICFYTKQLKVSVLNVEESDVGLTNYIRGLEWDTEMEFYFCDSSMVQIQLESILAIDMYPAILLVDGHNEVVGKDQFYASDWDDRISRLLDKKQLKGFYQQVNSSNSSHNNNISNSCNIHGNNNNNNNNNKNISGHNKNNHIQSASGQERMYKQLKNKFLQDVRTKKMLSICADKLIKLNYPIDFELFVSNQQVLDWEGSFIQKLYPIPKIQHNLSKNDSGIIKSLLDLLFSFVSNENIERVTCGIQLKRAIKCSLCSQTFILPSLPLKEEMSQELVFPTQQKQYIMKNFQKDIEKKGEFSLEHQYYNYGRNHHYCEQCVFKGKHDSHKLSIQKLIFIHGQAELHDIRSETVSSSKEDEVEEINFKDEVHSNVFCTGCSLNIVGRRWICLTCDRGTQTYKVNLCEQCQKIVKLKNERISLPNSLKESPDMQAQLHLVNHQPTHIMLGLPFFKGINVL